MEYSQSKILLSCYPYDGHYETYTYNIYSWYSKKRRKTQKIQLQKTNNVDTLNILKKSVSYVKFLIWTDQNGRKCIIGSTEQYTMHNISYNCNSEKAIKRLYSVFIFSLKMCFCLLFCHVSFGCTLDILPMNLWMFFLFLVLIFLLLFPSPPVLPLVLLSLSLEWFIQTWSPHSKHSALIWNNSTVQICTCELSI